MAPLHLAYERDAVVKQHLAVNRLYQQVSNVDKRKAVVPNLAY